MRSAHRFSLKDVLSFCAADPGRRVRVYPFRLVSRRTSPWSALELVRDHFQEGLRTLASKAKIPFQVREVEYPVEAGPLNELLVHVRGSEEPPPNLVLDLSAVPRHVAVHLCDSLLDKDERAWAPTFQSVYLVHTPFERPPARAALGPYSVGGVTSAYRPDLIKRLPEDIRVSLVVFPGYEGFEGKAAVDALSGHQALITIAVNCFEQSFPNSVDLLVGNQALIVDAIDGSVQLKYYFSEEDAVQLLSDTVEQALKFCEEHPDLRHLFLVAPFGPKWTVALACLARKTFVQRARKRIPRVRVETDVLVLGSFQYVSLYSRGWRTPHVMCLSQGSS